MYPEFRGKGEDDGVDPENLVFASVRDSLRLLGLDATRFGTSAWNPFRGIVRPGDHVLIKPNWVQQGHHLNDTWEQIVTHGAVIAAVVEYVELALEGRGRISLADGPMLSADFDTIIARTGIASLAERMRSRGGDIRFEILDLRDTFLATRDDVVVGKKTLPGDPMGGVVVNLGRHSMFYGFRGEGRYYGAEYDTKEVNVHHRGEIQEYRLSGTAIAANVIIDVPKLKTHQKVGVTLSIKGIVGLNSGRNWLPHRTQGTPEQGGDQFGESGWRQRIEAAVIRGFEESMLRNPRLVSPVYRFAKHVGKRIFGPSHQTVRGGSWYGNDTLWRMALDINRALMYADSSGHVNKSPTRGRFIVVDGIVAGEGPGPLYADPKPCGVIISGRNPLAVDIVATEMMGFDHARIPMLAGALQPHPLPLSEFDASEIDIISNVPGWSGDLPRLRDSAPFEFVPPLGWKGHMERGPARSTKGASAGTSMHGT